MYLPQSHIENTSQKHAKHTTNCNTAKSKACLTKLFEKTEIKWSPYLGKLPSTKRSHNTTCSLKQATDNQYIVSKPNVLKLHHNPKNSKGFQGKFTLLDTIPKSIVLINHHE
ncbi:hypothetical protein QL285_031984 [Trifolium repens]|nr:hypothetical protein QL285_031984 [Trifolium repens]